MLYQNIAAIDIVCNQNSPGERAESFKEIWKYLKRLKQHNVTVTIIWCPGHCDIKYNEIADEEAKKCALTLSQSEYVELDLREASYSTISKVIREFSYQQWQKAWERATAGCKTRDIIPSVRTKIRWSKLRDSDISYARMLLNSTNLNDNMYKMRLTELPNCDCNMDRETTEHYLLYCTDFESERQVMLSKIGKAWI